MVYAQTAGFESWALEFLDRILSLLKTQVRYESRDLLQSSVCTNIVV